jgi:imidazoleglycerol phosphate dehydratase HisB
MHGSKLSVKKVSGGIKVERVLGDSEIRVFINLKKTGKNKIDTGFASLDKMLNTFANHAFFDLEVSVKNGDENHIFREVGESISAGLGKILKKCADHSISTVGDSMCTLAIKTDSDWGLLNAQIIGGKDRDQSNQIMSFLDGFSRGLRAEIEAIMVSKDENFIEAVFKALGECTNQIFKRANR